MITLEQAKEIFEEQIKRLDVDYVDFYLLHALNKDTWKKVIDLNIIPYCEELKKQGRIKNFGSSKRIRKSYILYRTKRE